MRPYKLRQEWKDHIRGESATITTTNPQVIGVDMAKGKDQVAVVVRTDGRMWFAVGWRARFILFAISLVQFLDRAKERVYNSLHQR